MEACSFSSNTVHIINSFIKFIFLSTLKFWSRHCCLCWKIWFIFQNHFLLGIVRSYVSQFTYLPEAFNLACIQSHSFLIHCIHCIHFVYLHCYRIFIKVLFDCLTRCFLNFLLTFKWKKKHIWIVVTISTFTEVAWFAF